MKEQNNKIDRRNFLKTMGAAGIGSVFASASVKADPNNVKGTDPNAAEKTQETKYPQVPRRKLGKTGVDVPVLSFGAMFNIVDNQIILRKCLDWGVDYWDTAHSYANGNSEVGIGKFFSMNPDVRKKVFLVTKASDAKNAADLEKRLQESLKRMNTEYIDLYYGVHGLSKPEDLTEELRQWVMDAKKRKLIRYFGFSTHGNTANCLAGAAKLDWIDAIMTTYNIRTMQESPMQDAVGACNKAGIGLIAMKVLARGQKIETEEDKKLANHFLERGFAEGQAKIKAVLEDARISTACITMQNVALVTSNVAAVLDQTKLTQADKQVFNEYAKITCDGYCAGCGYICNAAVPDTPYVNDVMRYLMYYNSYGNRDMARELFAQIPHDVRSKLLSTDYCVAEARCPQHLPIGKLVAEAVDKLA